jgi:hypothetical protein
MILINHPNHHDGMADFCLKNHFSKLTWHKSHNRQLELPGSELKYLFVKILPLWRYYGIFCHNSGLTLIILYNIKQIYTCFFWHNL